MHDTLPHEGERAATSVRGSDHDRRLRGALGAFRPHQKAAHLLPVVLGERVVVTALHPFDAWAVVAGEPEPMGSHPSLDAALRRLGATGGAVTTGLALLCWHPATEPEAHAILRDALAGHGVHGVAEATW